MIRSSHTVCVPPPWALLYFEKGMIVKRSCPDQAAIVHPPASQGQARDPARHALHTWRIQADTRRWSPVSAMGSVHPHQTVPTRNQHRQCATGADTPFVVQKRSAPLPRAAAMRPPPQSTVRCYPAHRSAGPPEAEPRPDVRSGPSAAVARQRLSPRPHMCKRAAGKTKTDRLARRCL